MTQKATKAKNPKDQDISPSFDGVLKRMLSTPPPKKKKKKKK
jgi:hypothetical protein